MGKTNLRTWACGEERIVYESSDERLYYKTRSSGRLILHGTWREYCWVVGNEEEMRKVLEDLK